MAWEMMKMSICQNFSLLLPNLFIGLCKNSPILREYSRIFRNELGYEIFKFEPSFKTHLAGRLNPDAIIISTSISNTIVIEWTEINILGNDKKDQLSRYSKITSNDLINVAAIPTNTMQTYDIMLIVKPDSLTPFNNFLKSKNIGFPILTFDTQKDEYKLKKKSNDFKENRTNRFFTEGIELKRVPPLHYLPIPLDGISIQSVATFTITHLISLLIKGIQEFSIEDFCEGYIPVWSFIDLEKQNKIKTATKDVLSDLIKNPIGKNILARISDNPPKWKIKDDFNIKLRKKTVIKALEEFIKEEKGEIYQPDLPFSQ